MALSLEWIWFRAGSVGTAALAASSAVGVCLALTGHGGENFFLPLGLSSPAALVSWTMWSSLVMVAALTLALMCAGLMTVGRAAREVYVPIVDMRPPGLALVVALAPLPITLIQFGAQMLFLDGRVEDAVGVAGFGLMMVWTFGGNLLGYIYWRSGAVCRAHGS